MSQTPEQIRDAAEQLTHELIAKGKLIEAGFTSLVAMAYQGAPPHQLTEMRNCFFAGAHHLLASIMTTLDPGGEPTEADFGRIAAIEAELEAFIQRYQLAHFPAKGRG